MSQKISEEKRVAYAEKLFDAKILFDYFAARWQKEYHEFFGNYQPAIRKRIQRELRDFDLEELQARIRNFFATENSWVLENRHPIFYFLKYHSRFKCKNLHSLTENKNGQKITNRLQIATHENFDVEREIKKYYHRKTLGK
jgi:hypothetical protein